MVDQHLEAFAREPIFALDRLVGIGRGADGERSLLGTAELAAQCIRYVYANFDVAVEV